MVSLQPMSTTNFERWWARIWVEYRAELIAAGTSAEVADDQIAQTQAFLYPDGQLAAGNFVFDVLDGSDEVGMTWIADRGGDWFIYDIEVLESHRGRGLGRATMQAIEQHVRDNGGTQIGLSVFRTNETAHKLYLSEGYEVTRLSMLKKLS